MTKDKLADKIIEHIDNCKFLGTDPKEGILAYLDTLQPINLEQFSKWGYNEDKSTINDCWK